MWFITEFSTLFLLIQEFFHLRLHRFIHLDQRWPGAFETFAGNFLRRVNAQLAAAGDFARRVVEHVGRAFGESLRTATMLSRCGSVLAVRWNSTSLVLWTFTSVSTTTMNFVNIICPMPQRPCMIL